MHSSSDDDEVRHPALRRSVDESSYASSSSLESSTPASRRKFTSSLVRYISIFYNYTCI